MMTNSLAEFKISAENPAYKSVNGAILTKSGKTLLAVPYGMTVKEFVIPEGCDTIANDTFNTFMDLEKITFSSTLKHIGLSAFTYCNKMVNTNDFPETLELIGASAFSSCYKLQNLTVGPNVKMVGGMAFNNAITPVKVHVGSTTTLGANAFSSGRSVIKEIIFDTPAEGYTTIPTFAFQYAQIEEINVPEGFEIIEGRAFAQTTKVKTIDLPSTLKELGIAPFEKDAPDTLICRATTPPVYNNYNNANYPLVVKTAFETTKLFVPDASIDQYKEANGWKDIVNVLPLSQLSGVQDVVADDAVKTVATENFYDLNGREVAPSVEKKGLYIVRTTYTDGSVKTAKKVF